MDKNILAISSDELKELWLRSQKLLALEAAGVDNWDCFDSALDDHSDLFDVERWDELVKGLQKFSGMGLDD